MINATKERRTSLRGERMSIVRVLTDVLYKRRPLVKKKLDKVRSVNDGVNSPKKNHRMRNLEMLTARKKSTRKSKSTWKAQKRRRHARKDSCNDTTQAKGRDGLRQEPASMTETERLNETARSKGQIQIQSSKNRRKAKSEVKKEAGETFSARRLMKWAKSMNSEDCAVGLYKLDGGCLAARCASWTHSRPATSATHDGHEGWIDREL